MITGTIRRDGFQGLGLQISLPTSHRFPLGWVASRHESFLKRYVSWLYLKIRASYGQNGNQGIGRYSSLSRMSNSPTVFGSTTYIGALPSSLGNAELGWGKTSSFNVGIDYGFINSRISGSMDMYKS